MDLPASALATASADDRVRAEAAGLPVAAADTCWAVHGPDGSTLAYAVVLPGDTERCVRAVAAGDPGDAAVAEAVVWARERLLAARFADSP